MTAVSLRSRALCVTAICLSLWSCASQKPPFKVSVACAQKYAGHIHVNLCQSAASAIAKLDDSGNGSSSACPAPGDNVEILALRGNDSVVVPHENMSVQKTGDDIPIALDADLK
jgi:hypothetical protein